MTMVEPLVGPGGDRDRLPGVVQLVDTLNLGGLERMAVEIANALSPNQFRRYLCATRDGGPLRDSLEHDIGLLMLGRRWRFDMTALVRFAMFLMKERVELIHAHGSSLFFAYLSSLLPPFPRYIWHDHFGRIGYEERSRVAYCLPARSAEFVFAVNQEIYDWLLRSLRLDASKVRVLRNFVPDLSCGDFEAIDLPGTAGSRLVFVANLRPQKDHEMLLDAMEMVLKSHPEAHLFLVGGLGDRTYGERILSRISKPALCENVTWLGSRRDVPSILRACSIGVMSSRSEGLPLSLLEYGRASLPVVVTRVGQCPEVLGHGDYGWLVEPGDSTGLAGLLVQLIESGSMRENLGAAFRQRVHEVYGVGGVLNELSEYYLRAVGLRD